MLNQNLLLTGDDAYNLTRSLRFRSSASAYLSRTLTTPTNSQKWTFSDWVKRGNLASNQFILQAGNSVNDEAQWYFQTNNTIRFYQYTGSYQYDFTTAQVFLDPSAWYHLVVQYDSTEATTANRFRVYINGSQITLTTSTSVSLNATNSKVNSAVSHDIGGSNIENRWFDGYMTEINFIDGQALTPSSFGETDVLTGVWKPKKYAGTYGTNGFYLPFVDKSTASFAGSFNGSNQFLSLAQNAAFSFGTGDFTVETWINANSWRSDANPIISLGDGAVGGGSPVYTGWSMRYDTSNGIGFYRYDGAETFLTTGAFLSTGQWHHIAVSRSGGTLRIFANGMQVYSASNTTSYNNVNANTLKIGGNWVIGGGVVTWVNGQISNTRVVKGTGLYTANFTPAISNLTAVSGTSLLTLQNSSIVDNSTNAFTITNNNSVTTSAQNPFASGSVTSDQSGNGNNWLPNNINVSSVGTTYDSMTDVPTLTSATTANYAVLNPLISIPSWNFATLSNGNLTTVGNSASNNGVNFSTQTVKTGKWYAEFTCTGSSGSYPMVGITDINQLGSFGGTPGYPSNGVGYIASGLKTLNNVQTSYGNSFTTNDVIGIAVDADNGAVYFSKNGVFQNSGVPTSGSSKTGAAYSYTGGTLEFYLSVSPYQSGTGFHANFGQRPFSYTPPTGFVALNTFNLPSSTIVAGNKQMDVSLYSGNNSTPRSITGLNFQPDFVWIKDRSNAYNHTLWDVVRGVGSTKGLSSNSTDPEGLGVALGSTAANGYVSALNSNGFEVTSGSSTNVYVNTSPDSYVAWSWKANGTAVTNTAGTISAQVSANTTAGFSIVTWTNNNTANQSIGHGLGVTPSMIITKDRDNGSYNWATWFTGFTKDEYLLLNTTGAKASYNTLWYQTPDSSKFYIGSTGTGVNAGTDKMVAYCFAEVAGYSKFGSYTGNGSADGPFIYTGFRPKFVMVKRTDTAAHWIIDDSTRNTSNIVDLELYPSLSNAESSDPSYDFLSNGFKLRVTSSNKNASGGTYIYMAFAENPFKNALAR